MVQDNLNYLGLRGTFAQPVDLFHTHGLQGKTGGLGLARMILFATHPEYNTFI